MVKLAMNLFNAQTVLPVVIHYKKDDEIQTALVHVNYSQDEVYFFNNPELNTDEMRREILAALDSPHFLEHDGIPLEIWEQIEEVRNGNYGSEIDELTKETEEDGDE
jgi:hypothetical protein